MEKNEVKLEHQGIYRWTNSNIGVDALQLIATQFGSNATWRISIAMHRNTKCDESRSKVQLDIMGTGD